MSDFMTTREVAQLLRVKERKIYDLVAREAIPYSKATGKLLFDRTKITDWMNKQTSGASAPALIIAGSHDPLLEVAIRKSGAGLAVNWIGSADGIDALKMSTACAAPIHIFEAETNSWNIKAVEERCDGLNVVLMSWARRQRGLVINQDVKGKIQSFADLAGHKLVARQAGSGSQILFDHFCKQQNVESETLNFVTERYTEIDAILSIIDGSADVAFGLGYLAKQYGLDFVPLIWEQVDLLIDKSAYFDPAFQQLFDFCRSPDFFDISKTFTGYDISNLGRVHLNMRP